MDFKKEIITFLAAETKLAQEEVETLIAVPPDPKLGGSSRSQTRRLCVPLLQTGKKSQNRSRKAAGCHQ